MTIQRAWWGEDIIPRIRWRIEIAEGDEIPDGYGIAYYLGWRPVAVCMPIPFNVIALGWQTVIHWAKCPPGRLGTFVQQCELAKAWEDGAEAALMAGQSFHVLRNPYRR